MTGPVRLTPLAQADIDETRAWYAARSEAAALGILRAVSGVVANDLRRRNLNRYPYADWYLVEAEGTLVIACLHHRQRPATVMARRSMP